MAALLVGNVQVFSMDSSEWGKLVDVADQYELTMPVILYVVVQKRCAYSIYNIVMER